jgi:hypothetical protein
MMSALPSRTRGAVASDKDVVAFWKRHGLA